MREESEKERLLLLFFYEAASPLSLLLFLPPFPSLRKISPFFYPLPPSYLPKNQIGCNYTVVKVAGQKKTSFPSPCLWVAVATIPPSPILIFVPFAVAGFPRPPTTPFSVPPLYLIGATFLHPQRRKRDSTVVKGKKLIFRSLSLSVFPSVSPPLFPLSLFCR